MFELPEFLTLSKQMNDKIKSKRIKQWSLSSTPHRFVWYNRNPAEFAKLTKGKTIGKAWAKGKWLFVSLDPGYVLVLGECGGKVLYHPSGTPPPKNYHLCLVFEDDSAFTATTQMWGAMELYEKGGRYDEYDLYGKPGQYVRLMDKNAVERPCPDCGGEVSKIQYLGGACYLCSNCQK